MTTNYNVADWNVGGTTAALGLPLPHPETPSVAQGGVGQKGDMARIGHALKGLADAVAARAMSTSATFTQALTFAPDEQGAIGFIASGSIAPALQQWRTADGVVRAYMGWADGDNILIAGQNGWGIKFLTAPLIGSSRAVTLTELETALANLIGAGQPAALDTLKEVVDLINNHRSADDSQFGAILTQLAQKASTQSVTDAHNAATAAQATANGALPKAGGTMTGPFTFAPSGQGTLGVAGSGSTSPAMLQWRTADGTLRAYMGWASGNNIVMSGANGWNFDFQAAPTVLGQAVATQAQVTAATVGGRVLGRCEINGVTGALISSSGQIGAVVRNGVGDYTITPPAGVTWSSGYVPSAMAKLDDLGDAQVPIVGIKRVANAKTTSALRIQVTNGGTSAFDCQLVTVVLFGA